MSSCPEKAGIGLQLYSLKHAVQRDLIGALRQARQAGVDGVEFAGTQGRTARELRAVLGDLGLKAIGSHVDWPTLGEGRDRLARAIEYGVELGQQYIVCPSLPWSMTDSRDAWLRTAEVFERIGRQVADAGMKFAFHNHSIELETHDGEPGLGILYRHADPRWVRMELDTGWCDVTGLVRSVDFLREHAAHAELLHIKEITAVGDPTARVLGQGAMDWPVICALGQSMGVPWYIVEHEGDEDDPLQAITEGVSYLRGLL